MPPYKSVLANLPPPDPKLVDEIDDWPTPSPEPEWLKRAKNQERWADLSPASKMLKHIEELRQHNAVLKAAREADAMDVDEEEEEEGEEEEEAWNGSSDYIEVTQSLAADDEDDEDDGGIDLREIDMNDVDDDMEESEPALPSILDKFELRLPSRDQQRHTIEAPVTPRRPQGVYRRMQSRHAADRSPSSSPEPPPIGSRPQTTQGSPQLGKPLSPPPPPPPPPSTMPPNNKRKAEADEIETDLLGPVKVQDAVPKGKKVVAFLERGHRRHLVWYLCQYEGEGEDTAEVILQKDLRNKYSWLIAAWSRRADA